jgi:hypothetical protein
VRQAISSTATGDFRYTIENGKRRGCLFRRLGMEINLQTASPSTETLADFEPRNKLRVSGVELRQPTADLLGPGLFYTLLGLIVEAVNLGSQPKLLELQEEARGPP